MDKKNIKQEILNPKNENSSQEIKKTRNKKPPLYDLNSKKYFMKDYIHLTLLFFIAAGIWGIFFQNMNLDSAENFTQDVRVVNTVDTYVNGGNLNVDFNNTVDVNLEAINGHYNVFYDRSGSEFYHRIPVYTFD